MNKDYVSKHSKPTGDDARNSVSRPARRSEEYDFEDRPVRRAEAQQGSGRPAQSRRKKKKSSPFIFLLIAIILIALAVLVYLATNVFGIKIPGMSAKAAATPEPTAMATPLPTVEPTPEPTPAPTPAPVYVYTSETKPLDTKGSYTSAEGFYGDGFYASSWKLGDDGYSYVYQIYNLGGDGSAKLLDAYRAMDGVSNSNNWDNYFSSAVLTAVTADRSGNPVALESVISSGEQKNGEETVFCSETKNFVRTLDATGKEISSVELKTDEELTALGFRITADGSIALLTDIGTAVFAPDGTLRNIVPTGTGAVGIVLLNDGRVGVVSWETNGQILSVLSADGSAVEETRTLPDSASGYADGAGDYALFYTDGVELCGYDSAYGEGRSVLNWSAVDVSGVRVSGIGSKDGQSFLCATNEANFADNTFSSSIIRLTAVPEAQAVKRQELILASVNPVETLQDAVAEYNRSQSNLRIILKTLELGDTEADNVANLKQLASTDTESRMPDLVDLTGMPYEEMATAGLLEDLYPFLDSDPELNRDSLLAQVRTGMEINGKLYGTCSGFSLATVLGPKNVLGDSGSWTFDQYNAVTSTMGQGVSAFGPYDTQDVLLYETLAVNLRHFINWNDLTCSFENENFTKLLAFIKSLPTEYPENADEISVKNKNQFLERLTMFCCDDIILAGHDFNQNETYIGLPTVSGSGTGMNLYKDFAMTTSCTDKAAAWQFLRTYFTEAYQTGDDFWYFPSNASAFANTLAASKQVNRDSTGENIARAFLFEEGKDPQYFYQLTDGQANTLQNLVNNATPASCSEAIFDLISENIAGYLSGSDTPAGAAGYVQNAVSAYLSGLKQY